jgi:hypothetical protein
MSSTGFGTVRCGWRNTAQTPAAQLAAISNRHNGKMWCFFTGQSSHGCFHCATLGVQCLVPVWIVETADYRFEVDLLPFGGENHKKMVACLVEVQGTLISHQRHLD